MCFQRDSRKDQIIVWGFILGTAGLLGWAALQRVLEMRDGQRKGVLGRVLGLGSGVPSPGLRAPGAEGLDSLRSPRDLGSRGSYRPVETDLRGGPSDGG